MIKLYKRFLLWWKGEKAEERIKRYEEITNHCGHIEIPEER